MRKHLLLPFLVSTILSPIACETKKMPVILTEHTASLVNLPTLVASGQTQVKFSVSGITCGKCEGKIERRLKTLDGVAAVQFEDKKFVTITYDAKKITVGELRKTISDPV